jgi:hypothetical protein
MKPSIDIADQAIVRHPKLLRLAIELLGCVLAAVPLLAFS